MLRLAAFAQVLVVVLGLAVALAAAPLAVGAQGTGGEPGAPATATATDSAPGPAVTVLLYHPYPDSADPLGFPFPPGTERDGFAFRYGSLARQGFFEFPFVVTDGGRPVSGIPDPNAPFVSVHGAYEAAIAERASSQAPATMLLSTALRTDQPGQAQVTANLTVTPVAPLAGSRLHAWVALVEDHVAYQPPPALTNGVDDHRFTVRALADLGVVPMEGTQPWSTLHSFAPIRAPGEQLYVAAWLQNEAVEARFAPHEVVQATTHAVSNPVPTFQESKGVLVEMLSAVWCRPCLYGDLAAVQIVEDHGLPRFQETPTATGYWRPPSSWTVPILALVAGAAAGWLATRGRRPGA